MSKLPLVLLAFVPGVGLAIATLWLRGPGHGLNRATADEYLDAFHKDRQLIPRRSAEQARRRGRDAWAAAERWVSKVLRSTWEPRSARSDSAGSLVSFPTPTGTCCSSPGCGRYRGDLQGARDRSDLRHRSSVPERPRPPNAVTRVVAAASGYLALIAVNGSETLFPVHGVPALSFVDLVGAAGLGLIAAFGARGVCVDAAVGEARRRTRSCSWHGSPPRVARSRCCSRSVAWSMGESLVLTPGYGVVTWALDPKRSVGILLAVLLLRCLATTATVSGGGVGGLFVPLVVVGALLGRAFGIVVGGNEVCSWSSALPPFSAPVTECRSRR